MAINRTPRRQATAVGTEAVKVTVLAKVPKRPAPKQRARPAPKKARV